MKIAKVEVENFATKGEVCEAEKLAILVERPLHNIVGKQTVKQDKPQVERRQLIVSSGAQRAAKWRAAHLELHRERSRKSMRKLREKASV